MKGLSIVRIVVIPLMVYCNVAYSSPDRTGLPNIVEASSSPDDGRTIEGALYYLSLKHESEISGLGFSASQLNSIDYTRPRSVHNIGRFSTVKEFIAELYDLPNLQSLKVIKDGKYVGFLVKLAGRPSAGFALYKEGDEYFLKGLVDNDGITAASDPKDEAIIFNAFYSVAVGVFIANGVKG